MVLVDFTLAERWRVFGELSLRSVTRRDERRVPAEKQQAAPRRDEAAPHERPARRQAEALLMQRLL